MVLRVPVVLLANLRLVLTHPATYRMAVINFTLWGVSAACCLVSIAGSMFSDLPVWVWVVRALTMALDGACVYWAAAGWAAARAAREARAAAAAEQAAFDDIARHY